MLIYATDANTGANGQTPSHLPKALVGKGCKIRYVPQNNPCISFDSQPSNHKFL